MGCWGGKAAGCAHPCHMPPIGRWVCMLLGGSLLQQHQSQSARPDRCCPPPQVHSIGDWWEADPDSQLMRLAERAVQQEWGVTPLLVREGEQPPRRHKQSCLRHLNAGAGWFAWVHLRNAACPAARVLPAAHLFQARSPDTCSNACPTPAWPPSSPPGGTMPVASALEKLLGAPAVLLPMGQSSDNCHLANERIRRSNMLKGKNVVKHLLTEFGAQCSGGC